MKIIRQDLKRGEIKVLITDKEDLWYLSHIIDQGDIVKSKTLRKIKKSGVDERASDIIKITVFLALNVEKVELEEDAASLRILGTIVEGPDDIPLGSYHSFSLEELSELTIVKKEWLSFQIDKLKEASKEKKSKILMVVFDREEAYVALAKSYDYEILTHISGNVSKKGDDTKSVEGSFYRELIKIIQDYASRYGSEHIILASPSFWKEELLKEVKDPGLKKKFIQATCSFVDKTSFNEVLKRDEIKQALQEDRVSFEMKLVEQLLSEISKDALAVYGFDSTKSAVASGAASILLVSSSLISRKRSENLYSQLDSLMRAVEKMKGSITIINSNHDGGKKLDGLGGIGAILRYRLNY